MNTTAAIAWADANQRWLVHALDLLRGRLERGGGTPTDPAGPETPEPAGDSEPPAAVEPMSALERLCAAFGLSPFERDVLLLCAGAELDARFSAAITAAHGDARRISPTFGLALATLGGAHWSALTPDAPLRRWRLIDVGAGETLTDSPLRIDERILHYLAGVSHLDDRLHGLVEVVTPPPALVESHRLSATAIARIWSANAEAMPVIQITGDDHHDKQAVAAAACALVGAELYAIAAHTVPRQPVECDAFLRLWQRESVLGGCGLLVDWRDADSLDPDHESAIARVLEHVRGLLFASRRAPRSGLRQPVVTFEIGGATPAERQTVWQSALGPAASELNGSVDTLCAQFLFTAPAIRRACATALQHANAGSDLEEALWEACRAQSRPRLDDLAQRITSAATWQDLVLPQPEKQVLADIAIHVRQRTKVYDSWGFGSKSSRGLGISALFAGPSGTGKTMAAEVLANELKLDLYRIDLSQVVSKYIGETEKNLRRVFDAAEKGSSILLCDEADALFGKRSDVKDSHDRYANVEVSYLLQRMEAYSGLAILTTNMMQALDPAFMRRIRFIVHFPFPDTAQRAEIWRRVFPAATPTGVLDYGLLARLQVAGGSIRNIAMNAAFLAAEADAPVRMSDVLAAAQGEYAKLERPLTEVEIGG